MADGPAVIYFDHNATTPVASRVMAAMLPALQEIWGNPSSPHAPGRRARRAVDEARQQVAGLLGAQPESLVFTSGGTESITMAIRSAVALQPEKPLVLVSAIEHSASWSAAHAAVGQARVLVLPVAADGRYDLAALAALLREHGPKIALASLMWANNESGVLPGVEAAASLLKEHGVALHVDAVQAVGKVPVDVQSLPVDFLSLSGHKFHGPKGIGALYLRPGLRFQPVFRGGGQEAGRRAGTENVPGIVGLGAAAELAREKLAAGALDALRAARDQLEGFLLRSLPGSRGIGSREHRIPNTSCLLLDVPAAELVLLLDELGLCASSGSACSSRSPEPSRTLLAHGLSPAQALNCLRLSLACDTTPDEIQRGGEIILRAVARLRSVLGPTPGGAVRFAG